MDLVDTAVVLALVVARWAPRRRRRGDRLTSPHPRGPRGDRRPAGALGRALAWQTLAPVLPATLLALTVGALLGRGIGSKGFAPGGPVCPANAPKCAGKGSVVPNIVRQAQVPLQELFLYGLGTLVLVLGALGVGLLFLRSSTDLEELRAT